MRLLLLRNLLLLRSVDVPAMPEKQRLKSKVFMMSDPNFPALGPFCFNLFSPIKGVFERLTIKEVYHAEGVSSQSSVTHLNHMTF